MGMKLSFLQEGEGVKRIFSKKKKGVDFKRIGSSSKSGLPEDLVFEILLLLPVKSLLRFRCVCKSWYDLIGNPNFVSNHYYKSSNNTSKIIVEHDYDVWLLSNETLEVPQDLDWARLRERGNFSDTNRIVGSCYGIICLHGVVYEEYTVNLWNPSTRQSKVLPKPHHLPDSWRDEFGVEFGFCYDVKTNDFKVVKFVKLNGSADYNQVAQAVHRTPKTEVYSLSTNSWKIIDDTIVPYNYYCWTAVNGVLSNLSYAPVFELEFETENKLVLISFDTRDEVFLLTPLPAPPAGTRKEERYYSGDIAALNESVAFVQVLSGSGEGDHFFKIWVLNEYGSKGSWTKLYTIGEPNSNLLHRAWGFWKNSMLLAESRDDGTLVLCDLITQELKNLQVDEELKNLQVDEELKDLQVDEELNILSLIYYKESLVSI